MILRLAGFLCKKSFFTSKSDEVIYGFPTKASAQNTIVVFELEKGYGIDLQEISPLSDEYEVLLNRNSRFVLTSMVVNYENSEVRIKARQIVK